jgi:osmotically-inducible protein OsmY
VTREVVVRTLWLSPHTVDVTVDQGVVTLSGQMERKSETEIAVSMTRQVDGVVGVVDKLTWRLDDAHIEPAEQALHGVTDPWLRRL